LLADSSDSEMTGQEWWHLLIWRVKDGDTCRGLARKNVVITQTKVAVGTIVKEGLLLYSEVINNIRESGSRIRNIGSQKGNNIGGTKYIQGRSKNICIVKIYTRRGRKNIRSMHNWNNGIRNIIGGKSVNGSGIGWWIVGRIRNRYWRMIIVAISLSTNARIYFVLRIGI